MTEFDEVQAEKRRLERLGKTCLRCDQQKPLEDFPIAIAKGKAYRRGWCKACLKAYWTVVAGRRRLQRQAAG